LLSWALPFALNKSCNNPLPKCSTSEQKLFELRKQRRGQYWTSLYSTIVWTLLEEHPSIRPGFVEQRKPLHADGPEYMPSTKSEQQVFEHGRGSEERI
jgi:hypothetical protein